MAKTRSQKLIDLVAPIEHLAIIMHDNPDPDAIASGWALKFLLEQRLTREVQLFGAGAIVRAENLEMVRLLRPPFYLTERPALDPAAAAILVDCSAEATNHLLAGSGLKPFAVIDHHETKGKRLRLKFRDIRTQAAATAILTASYLMEQLIVPPTELATALLYAIRTETLNAHAVFSPLDKRVIAYITPFVDHPKLSDIENAPLSREYYEDLLFALQNTFIYEDCGLCFLPSASGPETAAEYADILVRCKHVKKVLCAALMDNNAILLSARTRKNGGDATELLRKTIRDLGGHCGGHHHRAGGKIMLTGDKPKMSEEMQSALRANWLAACGHSEMRGSRLVSKRDILEHLE